MASLTQSAYWTSILYPDSLPPGWETKLRNMGIPLYLSPLHQPDEEEQEGALLSKKPHYHLLYQMHCSVSKRRATALIFPLNPGFAQPQPVGHRHSLERYFIHLDNPEKEQFSEDNRGMTCGGYKVDYDAPDVAMVDIVRLILDKEITSIIELYGYLNQIEYGGLLDYVVGHQADVIAILNDMHYRLKEGGNHSSI